MEEIGGTDIDRITVTLYNKLQYENTVGSHCQVNWISFIELNFDQ